MSSNMKERKIGIVIVAYHNASMTERFINNELSKLSTPFHVIVVNNAATREDSLKLAQKCNLAFIDDDTKDNIPNGERFLIWSPDNLGYAKGNNKGITFLNRIGGFTHFLFSNDDITIKDNNIIDELANKIDENSKVGAAGPRIINLEGIDQNPKVQYISLYREIGWIILAPFRKTKKQRETIANNKALKSRITYWTSGAFMLVNAKAFNQIGGFDPYTFLYYEECILAEKLLKINLHFYYDATVSVIHFEGGSTTKNRKNQLIGINSKIYYYRKYKHTNRFIIIIYRILEYINYKLNA